MGFLDPLLPIFLMIGLGAALTRGGFLSPDLNRNLNRLAYWIGMPGLLFANVCEADVPGARPLWISGVILAATLVSMVAGYVAARLLRLPAAGVGTFVQAAFRGNLTFVGLPLLLFAFPRFGMTAGDGDLAAISALAMAPVMIVYNFLAVSVLLASHHTLSRESVGAYLRQIVTNPLVLALAGGLLASVAGLQLPHFLLTSLKTIGGIAIPAALFGVGGTLVTAPLRTHALPAAVAGVIKVALLPLAGYGLARAFGLSATDTAIATVFCATPTAAASFVMAAQLRGDLDLASSTIMASTLGSAVSLALALTLLG